MLYLTEQDVADLLPMGDCIGLMRTAFARLAGGEAINHQRRRLVLPTRSVLHYMAASDGKYFGIKVYSTNPKYGAHFLLLLYRAETADVVAVLEANRLGQIRTGAASGYATELLARPDSRTVGLIGCGYQARTQLEAVRVVLPVERVRVWSRSEERRTAFAREAEAAFGLAVEPAASAEAAVRGADIVITATNTAAPVLEAGWVAPGTHINAMGSNQAQRRELPADLVGRCDLVVVDSREQARVESGDLLMALDDAGWGRVRELQERPQRPDGTAITLFKSNGLAVEDVIAAGAVYERALAIPERASAAQFRATR